MVRAIMSSAAHTSSTQTSNSATERSFGPRLRLRTGTCSLETVVSWSVPCWRPESKPVEDLLLRLAIARFSPQADIGAGNRARLPQLSFRRLGRPPSHRILRAYLPNRRADL